MKRIVANITFLNEESGGRSQPIPVINYGCPVAFHGVPELSSHQYDCRLLMYEHGKPILPGETVDNISIIFLSHDEVIPYLRKGIRFSLWEGKTIAEGEIMSID